MRSTTGLLLTSIAAVAFCGCAQTQADDEASAASEDELTIAADGTNAPWWNANPSLSIGPASVNVENKGARGNDSVDDTAAFQRAIDALPSTGGTVVVPAART